MAKLTDSDPMPQGKYKGQTMENVLIGICFGYTTNHFAAGTSGSISTTTGTF